MTTVTVKPFHALLNRGYVDIYNVHGANLMNGYDVIDHKGLEDSVSEATIRFTTVCTLIMSESEKEKKIRELREKDETSVSTCYSRRCNVCYSTNPATRAVLTTCGHFLCMACVLSMEKNGRLLCPFCRMSTAYVQLQEEISDETKTEDVVKEEETTKNTVDGSISSHSRRKSFPTNLRHFVTKRFRRRTSSSSSSTSTTSSSSLTSTSPTPITHTIKVTNLPVGTVESDMRSLFSQHGPISNIRFVVSPYSSNSLHASIDFETDQAARNARSAFNSLIYRGRTLCLKIVE